MAIELTACATLTDFVGNMLGIQCFLRPRGKNIYISNTITTVHSQHKRRKYKDNVRTKDLAIEYAQARQRIHFCRHTLSHILYLSHSFSRTE